MQPDQQQLKSPNIMRTTIAGFWANEKYQVLFSGLTVLVVLYIEYGRRTGNDVPIPFLLLYAGAILSAYLGGLYAGIVSGIISGGFVVYASTINFGPPTLTGGTLQVTSGIVLYALSSVLMGRVVDQKRRFEKNVREQQQSLEVNVMKRTAELETLTQDLLQKNTAYQQAEDRYRLLFENTLEAIIVHENGIIREANNSYMQLSGYARDELIGFNIFAGIPKNARETVSQSIEQGRETPFELQLKRKDGTVIEVQFWGQNVIYEGQKARMVAIRDLTKQKQLDKQTVELSIERERSQFLDDFINDLSHDIRTPITSLKTFLYLLRKQTDDDKRSEYFDKMDIQVTQLAKLVENIITISRLEKRAKFTLQTAKVTNVLNPTVNSFQSQADSKSVTLLLEIEPDVPSLYLNPIEFSRAIAHLLENALAFTPDGGTITVSATSTTNGTSIAISDTGIGIVEEDLPYIFDRFFRTDKARNTNIGGSGLGLAIVKTIVESHSGTITVSSTPNVGSTFTIELPSFRALGRKPATA